MEYQVLSLITNQIYFDDIPSMISIKTLCKMSYEIFTTNIKRHENIAKLFQKMIVNYGLDLDYINEFITNSNYLTETFKELSIELLDNHYYSSNPRSDLRIMYPNRHIILYKDDKLSPFKHLKIKNMFTIKRQMKKSLLLQMALDHASYKPKTYLHYLNDL